MLVQWLALLTFASSERLHRAVCDDSQHRTHDCALVSLARGQLWVDVGVASTPVPPILGLPLRPTPAGEEFHSADISIRPGRGPPFTLRFA